MISEQNIPLTKALHPNLEEFSNFEDFVENLDHDKNLQTYGMIKIVPPKNWKPRKKNITSLFDKLSVLSPIEQNAQGNSGVYELLLIQKKSMKLNDYKKKVERFDKITEGKSTEEVEEMFWKNLAFSAPLYGADIGGTTLFEDGVPWNLNDLPGLLKEGLKNSIAGVNNPYLYIGSWKTLFGWHKEDLDLYAVNYNHYGKPKLWYCLPPSEGKKLEDFVRPYFQEGFKKCKDFIRHKTLMVNPYVLKQKIPDIKIHKAVQLPGEFIVTYGGAYHAGFNWGFNIAEAVNFGTKRWLKLLPNVGVCRCVNDSVKIQYKEFFKVLLNNSKYGKDPFIKKVCADNGIVKGKATPSEMEEEKVEEKTTLKSPRKRTSSTKKKSTSKKSTSKGKVEEEVEEKPKEKGRSKSRDSTKNRKEQLVKKAVTKKKETKTSLVKLKGKDTKKPEEEVATRISSRSRKIKKLDDGFLTPDFKAIQRTRRSGNEKKTKNSKEQEKRDSSVKGGKDVKQLVKAQNYDDLIVENWIQCDKCNKWRQIKGEGAPLKKLLQKKNLNCSNIPGRDCSQPEDKSAKDTYILTKSQEIIV